MEEKSVIGVDLGGTNIRVGKICNNNIINLHSQKISSSAQSEDVIIVEIINSIHKVFDSSVLGIGIGVPSIVDVHKGIVYDVQNIPVFKKVELKKILEEEFKIPAYINNDANCFVVGEKYFGRGKNYENIVGLTLGTGLGAGIYTNGKLYNGSNCGAGEFGMIPYKDGIFENYCSGQYFLKLNTTGEEVYKNAGKGDKIALRIFNEFGTHVANVIAIIIFAVDPEVIIFGGSASRGFRYFKNSIKTALNTFPYQNSLKNLKIVESNLSQASILGAAALYFENNK